MKTVKLMTAVALTFMVTASFASNKVVKSKLGDIELTNQKDGGSVICTAGFNDELKIVKEAESAVLVKGKCGQGWVNKAKLEYVAKGPGNKSFDFDDIQIDGFFNDPLINVFYDDVNTVAEVEINRDFKEYLMYTMDREQTEIRNGEN